MTPSETAQIVFDAIMDERFYVLTHPEHNAQIAGARRRRIVNDGTPPTLMPG